jgi:hypothetical protein
MKVIIDRFEGNYAVCEKPDRTMINIEKSKLPPGAREGDVLLINEDIVSLDKSETARRKKSMDKLMNELWK